jgi:hypothetical protein
MATSDTATRPTTTTGRHSLPQVPAAGFKWAGTANVGASRGLETGIATPPYLTYRSGVPGRFGHMSCQVNDCVCSVPERKSDYFVGVFFGGTVPTRRGCLPF